MVVNKEGSLLFDYLYKQVTFLSFVVFSLPPLRGKHQQEG